MIRSVIVGAGPTGLYIAVALVRRGHQVTAIDRDPGPDDDQQWDRKGVMQFHHPHFFRQQVADALLAEMPEVWDGLLAAGAVPAVLPPERRACLLSGRSAGLWIALMRPGRRQTASSHPVQPITGGGTRTLSRHGGALTGAGAGAACATPALGPG